MERLPMKMKITPVFFKTEKKEANAILASIQELIPEHAVLDKETFVETGDDLAELAERADHSDLFLEMSANIRAVPIRLLLRLGDFHLPIVLFGEEFAPGSRRLEAVGYWKHLGVSVFLPLSREDLAAQLKLLAAKRRIEGTRALVLGSRYNSPHVVTYPRNLASPLGVRIQSCPGDRFLEVYEKVEEGIVRQEAETWRRNAERVLEPTDEDLEKSARFYLAIRHLLEDYGASAFAMNCIPFVEHLRGTPCMALGKLNDEGVPSACEGDLTALMTMIFLERLAGRSTFMGNIIRAHPVDDFVELNHCVLPLRIAGYAGPPHPYILRDYHGRGYGVTASFTPPIGPDVTIARLDHSFQEMVLVAGRVIGSGEDYCRTNLKVRIRNVRGFMREVRGNHHILVPGDYSEGISELCRLFGIKPVHIVISST
jgi:L-fucose isomerase-like protein